MSKREQILQAALKLFTEHGFRGTSTAEISRQAGVATGTLFHHFKSKEELIEELYLGAKTELADYLQSACSSAKGTEEIIKQLWFAYVDWAINHESQYRFFKHCEASPYINDPIREKGMAKFVFVTEHFTTLAEKRSDDTSEMMLLDIFAGAMDGFIRHLLTNPEAKTNKSQWETAFCLCWKILI
jgi:AcrR family transcriptional regulator